jgi:hypothetical protein
VAAWRWEHQSEWMLLNKTAPEDAPLNQNSAIYRAMWKLSAEVMNEHFALHEYSSRVVDCEAILTNDS